MPASFSVCVVRLNGKSSHCGRYCCWSAVVMTSVDTRAFSQSHTTSAPASLMVSTRWRWLWSFCDFASATMFSPCAFA